MRPNELAIAPTDYLKISAPRYIVGYASFTRLQLYVKVALPDRGVGWGCGG
jgi:hypothetical protein